MSEDCHEVVVRDATGRTVFTPEPTMSNESRERAADDHDAVLRDTGRESLELPNKPLQVGDAVVIDGRPTVVVGTVPARPEISEHARRAIGEIQTGVSIAEAEACVQRAIDAATAELRADIAQCAKTLDAWQAAALRMEADRDRLANRLTEYEKGINAAMATAFDATRKVEAERDALAEHCRQRGLALGVMECERDNALSERNALIAERDELAAQVRTLRAACESAVLAFDELRDPETIGVYDPAGDIKEELNAALAATAPKENA